MSLIRVDKAASMLDITKARAYELVRRNLIPHVKIGSRQIRFDEDTLRDWIAQGGNVHKVTLQSVDKSQSSSS